VRVSKTRRIFFEITKPAIRCPFVILIFVFVCSPLLPLLLLVLVPGGKALVLVEYRHLSIDTIHKTVCTPLRTVCPKGTPITDLGVCGDLASILHGKAGDVLGKS
jgi:hypothetical protein